MGKHFKKWQKRKRNMINKMREKGYYEAIDSEAIRFIERSIKGTYLALLPREVIREEIGKYFNSKVYEYNVNKLNKNELKEIQKMVMNYEVKIVIDNKIYDTNGILRTYPFGGTMDIYMNYFCSINLNVWMFGWMYKYEYYIYCKPKIEMIKCDAIKLFIGNERKQRPRIEKMVVKYVIEFIEIAHIFGVFISGIIISGILTYILSSLKMKV